MAFVPGFRIYNSAGDTLLYTFPAVNYTNIPQSTESVVKTSNHRGKGSLIVEGGDASWVAEIRFTLLGDDYEAITVLIEALESAIEFNTPYLLRVDKTAGSYYNQANGGYKIKRIEPFLYEEGLRNWKQVVLARFEVNSW